MENKKKEQPSSNPAAELGRKGGQRTFARHGREHMSKIGKKGGRPKKA